MGHKESLKSKKMVVFDRVCLFFQFLDLIPLIPTTL